MLRIIVISFVSLMPLLSKANGPVLPDSLVEVKSSFDNYIDYTYNILGDTTLTKEALSDGLRGYYQLKSQNKLKDTSILTIADFSQSCNNERLYVIDMTQLKIIWKSLVSHGEKSGGEYAKWFSNKEDSHQSSIGFYVTGQRWHDGRLGECLQLYGREYCNYHALTRGIIVHKADYANPEFIEKYGTLGRSYGCPAVPTEGYLEFLDLIDDGSCYFIYHPDWRYHRYSKMLNGRDYLIEFGFDLGFLL